MKYEVIQHNAQEELETVIIETTEDLNRLLAHSHIHSAKLIKDEKEEPIKITKKK